MLVTMTPRERSKMAPNTSRMWVLGAYLVTTCSVTQQSSAFRTSLRSWPALSAGRSLRRRGDFLRGDVFFDRVPLLGFSAPDVRAEGLLSMKVKKVRQKGQVRRQRGGPRTDAEGYTAEAFGKQDQTLRARRGMVGSYGFSFALMFAVRRARVGLRSLNGAKGKIKSLQMAKNTLRSRFQNRHLFLLSLTGTTTVWESAS